MANLPWLLANGIHCPNSSASDPNFITIGNPDLISSRARYNVPIPPGGTLADYVPFYFTPKSPMFMNIKTGWKGITQRSNSEIAIMLSSCKAMRANGARIVFTDRHARQATARWTDEPDDLASMIDWHTLWGDNFARDDLYPDKMERYEAEALLHRHVPTGALLGITCVSDSVKSAIETQIRAIGVGLEVFVRPGWYFW